MFCGEKAVKIAMLKDFLPFRTDSSGQTVQTQIKLLLEQSDQGLHCLLFHLRLFDKYPKVWPLCFNFR